MIGLIERLELDGAPLLAGLLRAASDNPGLTAASFVERYRRHEVGPHLERLAATPHLIEDAEARKAEFSGVLDRLYEQARERAEAAQARAEELKWAQVTTRSAAGAWKSQFETARRKRLAAVADANQARRTARNALALAAEVRRLSNLLAVAGVASDRDSVRGRRRAIARRRSEVPRAEVQAHKIRKLYKALFKERYDNASRRRILDDAMRDYHVTRRLGDQAERVRSLTDETRALRHALKRSEAVKEKLKVRLVRAVDTARSMSPAVADVDRRRALGRSRRRKAALRRLSDENARRRRTVRRLRCQCGTQETELAKRRATRAVRSKALHGRRSERQDKPRTGRPRGPRPGAPGHGRPPRPGLEARIKEHNPPQRGAAVPPPPRPRAPHRRAPRGASCA